jgi:hypothetical protein
MPESASLTMLKKAGAEAAANEQAAEDTVQDVEVDNMTSDQLDALLVEQEIAAPEGWSAMDAAGKIAWLKSEFDETPTEEAPEPAPAPAPAPASNVVIKKAGTKKADPAVAATPVLETPATAPVAESPASAPVEPSVPVTTEAGDAIVAEAKAGKKGKKKSTAVSTDVAKTGDVIEADVIQDMVHEIENVKEKQVYELIGGLVDQTEMNFFKLGGVLSVAQANGWHHGYPSFKEMCENHFGVNYRRAMYWVEIYKKLANSGVPWTKVSKIGWTKLQIIASIITTENVDSWVQIASTQSAIQLTETVKTVKNAKAKDNAPAITGEAKVVTTMTFKVHSDQKATIEAAIAKAKEAAGSDVSTAALEFICMDYLGGMDPVERLQKMGAQKAFDAIGKAYPNFQIDVVVNEEDTGEAQAA